MKPPKPAWWGVPARLVLLVLSTGCLVTLAFLGWALAGVVVLGRGELAGRYDGWQVDAVEGALALGLVAGAVAASFVLVRSWRFLRGRTQHARAAVLAGLLPGGLVGWNVAAPAGDAFAARVEWASQHTLAAEADRRLWQHELASGQVRPPLWEAKGERAAPDVAARMLRASDLGGGWWAGQRPNPVARELSEPDAAEGVVDKARGILEKQHRSGEVWEMDVLLFQELKRYGTADLAATGFRRSVGLLAQTCGCAPDPRMVAGVAVSTAAYEGTAGAQRQRAVFRIGRDVFTLLLSGQHADSDLQEVLTAAIRRAQG